MYWCREGNSPDYRLQTWTPNVYWISRAAHLQLNCPYTLMNSISMAITYVYATHYYIIHTLLYLVRFTRICMCCLCTIILNQLTLLTVYTCNWCDVDVIQSIPGLEVFHVYILPSWWSVIALKCGYFFFSFSFHKLFVVAFLASAFVQNHYALHFLLQKDDVLSS